MSSTKHLLLPLAILSFAVLVLLTLSVFILAPNIQNNLAKQVKDELSKQSIAAKITLSGRDVLLSGIVQDNETKAKAALLTEKVCGIRYVDNQLLTEKSENLALLADHPTKQLVKETTEKADKSTSEEKLVLASQSTSLSDTENQQTIEKDKKATEEKKAEEDKKAAEEKKAEEDKKAAEEKKAKEDKKAAEEKKAEEDKKAAEEKKAEEDKKAAEEKKAKEETKTTASNKTNVLNYDTMLAAMVAYNKQKGRNPKKQSSPSSSNTSSSNTSSSNTSSLDTRSLQFIINTDEIIKDSYTMLDKWVVQFKKNSASNIKIIVTAEDSSLAVNRAKVLRKYLTDKGITESRIEISGKSGEDETVDFKENP